MGLRLRSALPLATEGTQEAPSYEEGVGDDGGLQGFVLQKSLQESLLKGFLGFTLQKNPPDDNRRDEL